MSDLPAITPPPPVAEPAAPVGPARFFDSRSEEAAAHLMQVGALVQLRVTRALKPYGLSPQAHDVLSFLSQHDQPLPAKTVAEAITTAVPDVTRLLDRLEKQGHIARRRSDSDKRIVLVTLTEQGRALHELTRAPLASAQKQIMGKLKKGERKELVRLLAKLSEPLLQQV